MIQNKDIVVVKGDKDSSVVIMKKSAYVTKLDTMIDDIIMKDTYVETTDNVLKELSRFQDFLCKNFHNYECNTCNIWEDHYTFSDICGKNGE